MAQAKLTTRLKAHLQRQITLPIWAIYYGIAWAAFFASLGRFSVWIQVSVTFTVFLAHPFVLIAIDRRRERRYGRVE